jgi:hypothetical protein
MEVIEKYPDKPWNWQWMSENTNITMEMIDKYSDKPWNWVSISRNPNLTMEFIEKYPDKPWDWYNISVNSNITIEMINKYPDKPWVWTEILCNPNITMDFIEKYRNKYWYCEYYWQCKSGISNNKFTKEKELFYHKYYRIYMATFKLQQYFNRMYDNPKYLFCRNRLDKLFSEI